MDIKAKAVLGFGLTTIISGVNIFAMINLMIGMPDYTGFWLGIAVINIIIFLTCFAMMMLAMFTNMCEPEAQTSQPVYDWAVNGE
jgi:hypothetical protein